MDEQHNDIMSELPDDMRHALETYQTALAELVQVAVDNNSGKTGLAITPVTVNGEASVCVSLARQEDNGSLSFWPVFVGGTRAMDIRDPDGHQIAAGLKPQTEH